MTASCPRCGSRVLAAGGALLEADPHPLGVLGPDGRDLPASEITYSGLDGMRGEA